MLATTKQYCVGLSEIYTKESINVCWKTFKTIKSYNNLTELEAFTDFVFDHADLLKIRSDIDIDGEIYKLL